MNQRQFELAHRGDWQALQAWLDRRGHEEAPEAGRFPEVYRRVCHHLALARSRMYSRELIQELNELVVRGHAELYRPPRRTLGRILRFLGAELPQAVRAQGRLVAAAAVLLLGPLAAMLVVLQHQPELVHTVLDPAQILNLEDMYEPGRSRLGRERESDSDVMMFGHYVFNNTGIGFRTFASGLLVAVGTVFVLLYNGLVIGAAAGHLTQVGYGTPFWSFVAGHSAFELTAVILCGAAGLRLGLAVLSPGRDSRLRALRAAAGAAIPLVIGGALLFLAAAFVEAFWSSTTAVAPAIKYAVGLALWPLLWLYLLGAGRRRAA